MSVRQQPDSVGLIGLGQMGSAICRRLLGAGYRVFAYDVRPEAVASATAAGAEGAVSCAEVGRRARRVMVSVPDHHAVRQVLFGEQGLAEGLAPGSLVIDLSSCHPEATRQLAVECRARGLRLIDAPVSGGVLGAETGTLAVMVGGDASALEEARPLLATFSQAIFHVGDVGSGHTVKAINNMLSAANLLLGCEAVVLGAKAGIDPARLIEVINASSGRNQATEVKFPRYILNGRFDAGFTLGVLHKDLGIACDLAETLGVPLFVANLVKQLYGYAITHGGADADGTTLIRHVEAWARVNALDRP